MTLEETPTEDLLKEIESRGVIRWLKGGISLRDDFVVHLDNRLNEFILRELSLEISHSLLSKESGIKFSRRWDETTNSHIFEVKIPVVGAFS